MDDLAATLETDLCGMSHRAAATFAAGDGPHRCYTSPSGATA
jgi:hypothetical protein